MAEYLRNIIGGRFAATRNERGASAVEYGLLIAGIAALIVIVVFALGGQIKTALYDNTCNVISTESGQGDCS